MDDELPYAGLRQAGKIDVFLGNNKLDVSRNRGASVVDQRGNLASIWGSVGTIAGVLDPTLEGMPTCTHGRGNCAVTMTGNDEQEQNEPMSL